MEDIDTRLETERPEVADALKSMNWEGRLEQARIRRKAVLKNQDNAGKRPVVRIIDAAAMAQRRASTQEKTSAKAEVDSPSVHVEAPETAVHPGSEPGEARFPVAPAAALEPERKSLAGRTALGFGLGLGLGTSLLVGTYLLLGLPYAPVSPGTEARAPVVAAPVVAAPVVAAPVVAAPVAAVPTDTVPDLASPSGPLATDSAPVVSAGAPTVIATSVSESEAATLPASLALPPEPLAIPSMPGTLTADEALRPALPLSAPIYGALEVTLAEVAVPVAAVAAPQPEAAHVPPRAARLTGTQVSLQDAVPAWGTNLPRLLEGDAPAALAAAPPPTSDVRLPPDVAAPLLLALPARPAPMTTAESAPGRIMVAPPPPSPLPESDEGTIPNGGSLFVRIGVPQTVPDDQANELAGLLKEAGIGDGQINRVGFKVSETHIRFYHSEDAAAAAALGEVIGTEARDFTSFRPSPPDGTLEIFLAGERTSPPQRVASPKRAQPQPPDELTRMRDRIVNRLRRGEHL